MCSGVHSRPPGLIEELMNYNPKKALDMDEPLRAGIVGCSNTFLVHPFFSLGKLVQKHNLSACLRD
jgi:hypothetical protein